MSDRTFLLIEALVRYLLGTAQRGHVERFLVVVFGGVRFLFVGISRAVRLLGVRQRFGRIIIFRRDFHFIIRRIRLVGERRFTAIRLAFRGQHLAGRVQHLIQLLVQVGLLMFHVFEVAALLDRIE